VTFERQFETCQTLIRNWHGKHGQRLNIALITPTLREEHRKELSASDMDKAIAQAQQVSRLARDNGLVFTQDGHTTGSVAFAHTMGVLGPEALLSHSTGLTEDEIRICAETDTKIAHNPSAIASVLARCPAIELMDAGVTVALGSDATAPDRNGDMFRHMQQAMHYHKTFFKDPKVLPAGKALEMCTIDAAKALGLENDIGSLEKGKKADVVLVDMARPHLYPLHMPVFRLVHFANGNDVATVIVDGKLLMENGKVKSVNEAKVLERAQAEAELMLDRGKFRALLKTPATFWGHTRAS
jgi:5-methylthioadenosine/S-adenosylhomocysteine deaminase